MMVRQGVLSCLLLGLLACAEHPDLPSGLTGTEAEQGYPTFLTWPEIDAVTQSDTDNTGLIVELRAQSIDLQRQGQAISGPVLTDDERGRMFSEERQ